MRKVLVVNKYHFISGGAERYFLSVMESMKRQGVEPIPLSVNYPRTLPGPYNKYFTEPVIQGGEAKIQKQNPNAWQKFLLAAHAIYNPRTAEAVRRIVRDYRPDLAYFLNFNNHISPSAIDACVRADVPVVMRMSDFNLTCASNMYYRDGHPCMDCKGSLYHGVVNRCVHGSVVKSAAAALAIQAHRVWGIYGKVSGFVTPTQFMKRELVERGIPGNRIHQINTFATVKEKGTPELTKPYILFSGRFAPYKGPDIAIRAFAAIEKRYNVRLLMVGDENDSDSERLKKLAHRLGCSKVEFLPFERDKDRLLEFVRKALFALVPSENYENLPNTILESFSCGRPVIATRLGSLPDIVEEGRYGLLYDYGDAEDFARKMAWLIEKDEDREVMGERVYEAIRTEYSEQQHMERIFRLFESLSGKTFPRVAGPRAKASYIP